MTNILELWALWTKKFFSFFLHWTLFHLEFQVNLMMTVPHQWKLLHPKDTQFERKSCVHKIHPNWTNTWRYITDDHMITTVSRGCTDPAISPSWLWNPSDLSSLNFDLRLHMNRDTISSLSFLPQTHRPLPPKIFTEMRFMELRPLTPEQQSMCAFFWSRHVHVRWARQLNVSFFFLSKNYNEAILHLNKCRLMLFKLGVRVSTPFKTLYKFYPLDEPWHTCPVWQKPKVLLCFLIEVLRDYIMQTPCKHRFNWCFFSRSLRFKISSWVIWM